MGGVLSAKRKMEAGCHEYLGLSGHFKVKMKTRFLEILSIAFVLLIASGVCQAARLKDVADIEGVRGNQLFGYGIVVGSLNGTGDGGGIEFTRKSLANVLEKMGLRIDRKALKLKT